MSHQFLKHTLTIGPLSIPVADLLDASCAYQDARDQHGAGASGFPQGSVTIGDLTYRVSYNGRVWHGDNLVLEAQ